MGSLMLLFAGFGWAKPVPVNPYALSRRSPAALMWVSLAGPLSNLGCGHRSAASPVCSGASKRSPKQLAAISTDVYPGVRLHQLVLMLFN